MPSTKETRQQLLLERWDILKEALPRNKAFHISKAIQVFVDQLGIIHSSATSLTYGVFSCVQKEQKAHRLGSPRLMQEGQGRWSIQWPPGYVDLKQDPKD